MCFPNLFLFCHSSLISCHSPLIKVTELCYWGCHLFFSFRLHPNSSLSFFFSPVISHFQKQQLCTHFISFRMQNDAYSSMSGKLFTLLKQLVVSFGFLVYSYPNISGSWELFNACFGVIWLSHIIHSIMSKCELLW